MRQSTLTYKSVLFIVHREFHVCMLDNAKKSMNVQDRMVPYLEQIVEAEEIDLSGHARSMKSM